ncbi:MAG: hypothetical protein ACOCQR_01735 [bacterium]
MGKFNNKLGEGYDKLIRHLFELNTDGYTMIGKRYGPYKKLIKFLKEFNFDYVEEMADVAKTGNVQMITLQDSARD